MTLFRAKNRRRRSAGQRLGTVARTVAVATKRTLKVILVLGLIGALPIGIYQGYQALMRSEYFVVSAVTIEGNEKLTRDDVLEISGLAERRNIFALDADRVQLRIESNPWVIRADVELELPRTVHLTIVEREPAGWLHFNELYRIDTDGFVIERGSAAEIDGPLITGLEPVPFDEEAGASGPEGRSIQLGLVRSAMSIAHFYGSQGLLSFDELAEIHFDELVGFSLLTRNYQMEVRLGHDRYLERLGRLRDVLQTLHGDDLMGRYILLDAEGALTRVAVGPVRPGRGVRMPREGRQPHP